MSTAFKIKYGQLRCLLLLSIAGSGVEDSDSNDPDVPTDEAEKERIQREVHEVTPQCIPYMAVRVDPKATYSTANGQAPYDYIPVHNATLHQLFFTSNVTEDFPFVFPFSTHIPKFLATIVEPVFRLAPPPNKIFRCPLFGHVVHESDKMELKKDVTRETYLLQVLVPVVHQAILFKRTGVVHPIVYTSHNGSIMDADVRRHRWGPLQGLQLDLE